MIIGRPPRLRAKINLMNYAALLRKTGRTTKATKMEARARAIRAKYAKENPAN